MVEWARRYRGDTTLFALEALAFEPDEFQDAMFAPNDGRDRRPDGRKWRGISVRSGHGVGKTAALAVIIIHHSLFRFPQKVAVTAPTKDQLFDVLVPEVKSWIKRLPPTLRELLIVKIESIELTASPDESFVSFKVSRPENPEALAGVHSENILLIADEASGVHERIFESAAGSMSAHNALTILTGNPVRSSGMFYDTHHNKAGSHWKTIHVSAKTSKRVSSEFVDQIAAQYGIDSNQYRVRILGEFPKGDDDTIIPAALIEGAEGRDVEATPMSPIWGLDVARFGNDASALAKRKGNTLTEPVKMWRGKSTMEIAGIVKAEYESAPFEERPTEIIVDSIGVGAGVVDRLVEMGLPAAGLNVSESPAFKELYADLRTELWFKAKEWFERRDVNIGTGNEELAAQLKALKYKYLSTGKMRAESKDDLKKRDTKMGSPDLADAFVLTMAREAVVATHGSKGFRRVPWNKPLKRNLKGIV
jgi:hypothetical protein